MEKEFIPYTEALALKELGFKEPCFGFYRKEKLYLCDYKNVNEEKISIISAPLLQQAYSFFDDNTDYKGFIVPSIKEECFDWEIYYGGNKILECNEYYSLRENAELECLKKLIEIAKEQNVK